MIYSLLLIFKLMTGNKDCLFWYGPLSNQNSGRVLTVWCRCAPPPLLLPLQSSCHSQYLPFLCASAVIQWKQNGKRPLCLFERSIVWDTQLEMSRFLLTRDFEKWWHTTEHPPACSLQTTDVFLNNTPV